MGVIVSLAEGFNGVIAEGGTYFMGLVTGNIPNLIVLLTLINAIIALVGEERVSSVIQKITKYRICRYTVVPFLALFFFTNPMCYTMARFVKPEEQAACIDSMFSLAHPMLGIFSHVNPGEIFVWTGISAGVAALGCSLTPLALRYMLVGIIVAFIRGNATEFLCRRMMLSNKKEVAGK